ncbi:MAG: hypothetical protein R3C29_03530 [Dehalococcoidia bacterium]
MDSPPDGCSNNDPQQRIGIDLGPRSLTAHYTGGATLFPGTSRRVNINIVMGNPDDCDSVDNDNDLSLDEDCEHDVNLKSVGGGTVVNDLTAVGTGLPGLISSAVAAPGDLTSYATVNRTAYCPGCIRQVYMALAENPTANSPATVPAQGPVPAVGGAVQRPGYFQPVHGAGLPGRLLHPPHRIAAVFVRRSRVGSPATSAGRVVVQSDTATAVTSSISSNAFGSTSPVTFTATVSRLQGAAGIPEGRVAFTGISGMSCADRWSAGVPANNVPIDLGGGKRLLAIDCGYPAWRQGRYYASERRSRGVKSTPETPTAGKSSTPTPRLQASFNITHRAPVDRDRQPAIAILGDR